MFENDVTAMDSSGNSGTVVGSNVRLTGTIQDVNDIIIYGTVEGEVISDKMVTIAETAKVKGPISAEVVSVAGTAEGAIDAKEKLELLATGQIDGSIITKDLVIKSGAVFNGKCQMTNDNVSLVDLDLNQKVETPKEAVKPADKKDKKETLSAETLPEKPTFELED